jgi:hypothetical protein
MITVNWATKVISVPQADLLSLGGGVYQLDVDELRLSLKDIEDSEEGINFADTHRHNTEVTLGGVTLARVVEIINGYTITFEDGQYAVKLVGANNNVADVTNVNQVSVRSNNSAGLIVSEGGSGGASWQDEIEPGFTAARMLRIMAAAMAGVSSGGPGSPVFRNLSDSQDQVTGTVTSVGDRSDVTYGS